MLTQITNNIFFLKKTRTKMFSVVAQTTINILQFLSKGGQRQITKMCCTYHKKQFFSMKGQGQKCSLC